MPIDGMMEDDRYKTAEEIEDIYHSCARIARTAVMSDDPDVKKSLKTAILAMAKTAMAKIDESINTSLADDEDE